MSDDDDIQAAELALGLLDGEDRAAALRRVLAEPAFAASVERWRVRFAQLFDLWPEAEPPEGLIDRIDLAMGGPVPMRSRRLPWPLIATVATAIAATLLMVVLFRPVAPPAPPFDPAQSQVAQAPAPAPSALPQPMLVAALGETTPVPVVFEPATRRLRLAGAPAVAAGRVPQLWVIGADAVPRSLGLIGGDTAIVLAPADAGRLVAGATLAVSAEPPGGAPGPAPTGPVVATGALRAV